MKKRSIIVSYAALTLILTAGAAQSLSGSNTVFSDDIVDGQVKFADIKPDAVTSSRIRTDAVNTSEVKDNALTGADVNEEALSFPTAEVDSISSPCFADSGEQTCSTTNITLASPGKVLIMATYIWNSDSSAEVGEQSGTVRLKVDGVAVETVTPGDNIHDNSTEYPQPILELQDLAAGTHTISLTFQENNAASDVDLRGSHIVATKISA